MTRYSYPVHGALAIFAAGLILLSPGVVRASPPTAAPPPVSYTIQPIVKLGDAVADVMLAADSDNGYLAISGLSDSGQLAFVAANGDGSNGDMLLQYAGGKFTPIVVGGRDAPGGKWPSAEAIYLGGGGPVLMNQRGNMAFAANETIGGKTVMGTYRWDFKAQQVTAIALDGMPAVNNLTFVQGATGAPVINNSDEIAFPATVMNAAKAEHGGIFLRGQDGQLQAVALPDQVLPNGVKIQDALQPDLNDAGAVAFVTASGNNNPDGAYLWENGTIAPLAVAKQVIPGVGTIDSFFGALLNNQDHNVILDLYLASDPNNDGLFLLANGAWTPLVVPGQDMPGGGKLVHPGSISGANKAGQRAFLGRLDDGTRSAYLLNADGTTSLVLRTGVATPLGKVTNIGQPSPDISLNDNGQIAVNVAFDGITTMIVLTPTAP